MDCSMQVGRRQGRREEGREGRRREEGRGRREGGRAGGQRKNGGPAAQASPWGTSVMTSCPPASLQLQLGNRSGSRKAVLFPPWSGEFCKHSGNVLGKVNLTECLGSISTFHGWATRELSTATTGLLREVIV